MPEVCVWWICWKADNISCVSSRFLCFSASVLLHQSCINVVAIPCEDCIPPVMGRDALYLQPSAPSTPPPTFPLPLPATALYLYKPTENGVKNQLVGKFRMQKVTCCLAAAQQTKARLLIHLTPNEPSLLDSSPSSPSSAVLAKLEWSAQRFP